MNQIKDEALTKMAKALAIIINENGGNLEEWKNLSEEAQNVLRATADMHFLSLSGETDEVCEFCQGQRRIEAVGMVGSDGRVSCPECNGTGAKKAKWHIEIVEG